MGLADRDYMRERRPRGEGPFTPPTSAGGTPALHIILIWLLVGLVLWIVANWFLTHQRATRRLAAPPQAVQLQSAVKAARPTSSVANRGPLPRRQQPAGHQMHGRRQDDVLGRTMSDGRAGDNGANHASPARPATATEVSAAPNPNARQLATTTHRSCSGAATLNA